MRAAEVESLEIRALLSNVVVTTAVDTISPPPGTISLRSAIATANAATSATTITFASNVSTIVLNGSALELSNTSFPTTIMGTSAGVTVSGNGASTVFEIDRDVTATLENLTITDGSVTTQLVEAGGILNYGSLTLTGSTVTGNTVYPDNPDAGSDGATGAGGIWNGGSLTLTNDTIADNTAVGNTGTFLEYFYAAAGGIFNDGSEFNDAALYEGTATLTNVTVADNTGTPTVSTATMSAGILNSNPSATSCVIGNSIVATNTNGSGGSVDVCGTFDSPGFNLVGATTGSTGFNVSDLTGTIASPLNADLGALANNGGPTETLLPARNSPAVDAGSNMLIPSGVTTDQRGEPRIYNGTVDIGSVELQAAPVVTITITPPANQTATTGQSQAFSLGSFTEANATGPYTVTVNWGDGSADTVFQATAAGALASQLHTYNTATVETITVSIADSLGDNSNDATFTATVAQAISPVTTTSIVASTGTAQVGSTVTFTAQVTPTTSGAPAATGSVSFLVNGSFLGSSTLNTSGQASYSTGALPLGADSVVAQYNGSSTYDGSTSAATTVNVTALPVPTASLSASSTSVAAGGSVTLTAILGATDGAGTPTGSVTFLADGTAVGTATLQSNGKATLAVSSAIPAMVTYTASYNGSSAYSTISTGPVSATYTSGTTVTLSGPSALAYAGESLAFTATVAADVTGGATPAGLITFFQGTNSLGTAILANGQASLSITTLPVGTNSLTAVFPAEGPYGGSTSVAMSQTVLAAPNSTISVTSSAGAGTEAGQPVTMTAQVSVGTSATPPTGNVVFTLNGTALATVPVQSNGTAAFTSSTLPTGSDVIVATYSGDANYSASLPVTAVVNIDAPGPVVSSAISSTLPGSIIAGGRLSGVIKLQIANPTQTTVTGRTQFIVYALGSNETSNALQSNYANLHVQPGKSQTVSISVNTLFTLPNDTYAMQVGVYTASGQINVFTTSQLLKVALPFTQLEGSSLVTSGLTGTVISGISTRGSIKILVKNQGNVKWSGPTTFTISASAVPTALGTQVASITRTLTIATGKTKTVVLPLETLPALNTGSNYLVTQISTPGSTPTLVASANTISFAAPVVSLTAMFARGSSKVLTAGAYIIITNTGNIDDTTTLTVVTGFSTDAAGLNAASGLATHTVSKLRIKGGKSVKIHLDGWKPLASALTAGGIYYATATLTDDSGHSAFAVNTENATTV